MNTSIIKEHHSVSYCWNKEQNPEQFKRSSIVYDSYSLLNYHNRIPNYLTYLLTLIPDTCVIAGGAASAILSDDFFKAGDVDLFFTSDKGFRDTLEILLKNGFTHIYETEDKLWEAVKNPNVYFIHLTKGDEKPLQLIKTMWFDSPEHVIDTFDYTCCQVALTNKNIYYSSLTKYDIFNRELVLHRMINPVSALKRMVKYMNKGYNVSKYNLTIIANGAIALLEKERAVQIGYLEVK